MLSVEINAFDGSSSHSRGKLPRITRSADMHASHNDVMDLRCIIAMVDK